MFHTPLSRIALATTMALTGLVGCATPNATTMQAPSVDQGATADAKASARAEQADERDMEDYGLTTDESSAARYALMDEGDDDGEDGEDDDETEPEAAEFEAESDQQATDDDDAEAERPGRSGAGEAAKDARKAAKDADKAFRQAFKAALKAEIKAKVKGRHAEKKEKSKARRALHKGEHDAIAKASRDAAWVDNGDGTKTKTFETTVTRTVNGETMTRHVLMVRTMNADGIVIADHTEFSQTLPNGVSKLSVRDKSLQADGTYKATYHAEMTFEDGTKRVTDWSKTIGADGSVTGTGTITWTDQAGAVVKTVTVTLGGTEDDEQVEPGAPAPTASLPPATDESPTASASPSPSATASAAS